MLEDDRGTDQRQRVVLKPASDTPHCAALLVELMAEAGFPPGVVNMVTGSGEEVGMPLVENPDVNVISFTGNGVTGRQIAIATAGAATTAVAGAGRQERDRRHGRR